MIEREREKWLMKQVVALIWNGVIDLEVVPCLSFRFFASFIQKIDTAHRRANQMYVRKLHILHSREVETFVWNNNSSIEQKRKKIDMNTHIIILFLSFFSKWNARPIQNCMSECCIELLYIACFKLQCGSGVAYKLYLCKMAKVNTRWFYCQLFRHSHR